MFLLALHRCLSTYTQFDARWLLLSTLHVAAGVYVTPLPNARNRCASCQLTTTVLNWHPSVFCTTRAYGHRCVHGQFHAICFLRSTKMVVVNWHPRLSIYNLDLVKTRKFPWSSIDNQGYQLTSWRKEESFRLKERHSFENIALILLFIFSIEK